MRKAVIVKLFLGSLIGFVGATVLFFVAGGLALWSDAFIMSGPDVVGVQPDPFGWVMIGLAVLAILLMGLAAVGLFVAWVGAVVNTASLPDKTWFIVLLVGGLVSVGFVATVAYVIAGPDGIQPTAPVADVHAPLSQPVAPASPPPAPSRETELTRQ